MNNNFADRLLRAIDRKGAPVCVGIDPVYQRLPKGLRTSRANRRSQVEAIGDFCREVLQIVAPIVPVVKIQSAYFEVYRQLGVELYFDLVRQARALRLMVIDDVKRGDIGSTAQAYAEAYLSEPVSPDAITVNGYFGTDGLEPFVTAAAAHGKGIFVLVRTSNPSAAEIQDFAGPDGRKFCEHVAQRVAQAGSARKLIGTSGYSCVGAVVGATYPAEAASLRQIMPQQVFLVPGYGAQGAKAEDCAAAFKPDGTGAVVNASRSVIFAYERREYSDLDWTEAIDKAARDFSADIARAVRP